MTGRAYRQSALIAAGATGPYEEYEKNRDAHNGVMRMHRDASYDVDPTGIKGDLLEAAQRSWDEAVELGEEHGYRNAQATVLAPTGTISFLMDCDTTGIEPDFSLVKFKELVGGGQMTIVNRSVPLALRTLGYAEPQVEQIDAHIAENSTIIGAPGLKDEHLPVFDVAVGERAISHTGHIDMMAATQPFISGAISKTVNLPQTATIEDIADAYTRGWKGGLKALAIYRDGSKTAQALRTDAQEEKGAEAEEDRRAGAQEDAARARVDHPQVLDRRPRGLHHRRQVRGRQRRRDLPHRHRQGGLDDARAAQRLRHGDLDRPPVRRAAGDLRAQVQLHALRAGGHHRQPGDPLRQVDARLHHALAGSRFIEDTETLEDLGILTQEVRAKRDAETTQLGLGIDTSGGTAGPANGGNGHSKPATATVAEEAKASGGQAVPASRPSPKPPRWSRPRCPASTSAPPASSAAA